MLRRVIDSPVRTGPLIAAAVLLIVPILTGTEDKPAEIAPQCAQICIYHSCRLLGIPVEMKDILARMPPDKQGNSFQDIEEVFHWIGLDVRGRLTDYAELVRGPFPAIAHFPNHFVVVEAADDEKVRLQDGFGRRITLTVDDFKNKWDGKLLEIILRPAARSLPAYVGEVQPGAPRIKFTTLVNYGGLIENPDQAEPIDFNFDVENRGRAPLDIKNVRADCACAVAAKPEKPLAPGERGKITIKYDPKGRRGPFKHTAYVGSNDPVFPVIALVVAGTTQQTLDIIPSQIAFGPIVAGGTQEVAVFLHYKGEEPFEITAVSTTDERVKARISPLSPEIARKALPVSAKIVSKPGKDSYILSVSVRAEGTAPKEVNGNVEIRTNVKRLGTVCLPYSAQIVSDAVTSPALVFLGEAAAGVKLRSTVSLSIRDSKPCRVFSAKSDIEGLSCSFPDEMLNEIPLAFVYVSPAEPTTVDSSVTVEYVSGDTAKADSLTVPVYIYAPRAGTSHSSQKSERASPEHAGGV